MNKMPPSFHIILVFLALVQWVSAADSLSVSPNKTDSIENLDKVVVTASRTKRILSETPANVSIITKSTIASSAAKSIEDLLITQTGVQAIRSVFLGEGTPSDIIIRGIPGSLLSPRVLILVDGIPTNASGTPFLIINQVPMEAIERIEIVRGPYSSLYGANAFGGVINIITRDGYGKTGGTLGGQTSFPFNVADQYFSSRRSMATSLKNGGSAALWNINGTGSGGNDDFGFLASMGYTTVGNDLFRDYAIARNGDEVYRKTAANNNATNFQAFGKTKYFPSENSAITFFCRYYNGALGYGRTKNILPDSMDVDIKGETFLVGPRAEMVFSKYFTLRAGGFYRFFTGEYWNEEDTLSLPDTQRSRPTYWKARTNDWQVESQGLLSLGRWGSLMIGFDFLRNNANFGAFTDPATGIPLPHSRPSKKAIVNGAGYIQEEAKLLDRFNLTPVIRWDYHSEFGSTFSPKLGVSSLLIDELRFHASAGRSFRAPSLAEMYLPDFPVTPGVKLKPNSNLKPEYIWGFDAGFDFDPVHALAVKIGAFYNSMDNLINQTIVSNPTVCVTHRNIAKATSEGIEAELQWRPLKAISLAAHATLQDSWDKSYKAPLDYVPKKMAGSSMRFSDTVASKKMEGQIVVNYVGKRSYLDFQHSEDAEIISTLEGLKYIPRSRPLPSYYTIDVSYRIFLLKRLCLHLAVQNLLNAEYKEAPGNLAPGILPTIKAGYDF